MNQTTTGELGFLNQPLDPNVDKHTIRERECPGCQHRFRPAAVVGPGNAKCPKCARWTS